MKICLFVTSCLSYGVWRLLKQSLYQEYKEIWPQIRDMSYFYHQTWQVEGALLWYSTIDHHAQDLILDCNLWPRSGFQVRPPSSPLSLPLDNQSLLVLYHSKVPSTQSVLKQLILFLILLYLQVGYDLASYYNFFSAY